MNYELFRKQIEDEVGVSWLHGIPDEQINHFIRWAARCQVYFGKNPPEKLGDAFRGFAIACEFHRNPEAWK
jgi:hypothetical protein